MIVKNSCQVCVWFLGEKSCSAFAEIPDEIWEGVNDHGEVFEGDKGIVFEKMPKDLNSVPGG